MLTYDSPRLDDALDLIGEVSARVVVRTDQPDADVFVRLCDVAPSGRSTNVTDGLRRLRATDGPDERGDRVAEVELSPTAYRFRHGHRLRVQVAGGAFPNYSRNHQTGDPIATAERMLPGTTTVRHGAAAHSISLPVYGRAGLGRSEPWSATRRPGATGRVVVVVRRNTATTSSSALPVTPWTPLAIDQGSRDPP